MMADLILIAHFFYVSFVIGGLLAVWIGAYFRWAWIRNFWFRILHLTAIAFVALESVFGVVCPLTKWENELRYAKGGAYETTFIQHWVHKILFYNAPEYVFTIIYVIFTLAVAGSLLFIKPRKPF
jgi:MFS family permease